MRKCPTPTQQNMCRENECLCCTRSRGQIRSSPIPCQLKILQGGKGARERKGIRWWSRRHRSCVINTKMCFDGFCFSEANEFTHEGRNRFGILGRLLRALWNLNSTRQIQEGLTLKNKGGSSDPTSPTPSLHAQTPNPGWKIEKRKWARHGDNFRVQWNPPLCFWPKPSGGWLDAGKHRWMTAKEPVRANLSKDAISAGLGGRKKPITTSDYLTP